MSCPTRIHCPISTAGRTRHACCSPCREGQPWCVEPVVRHTPITLSLTFARQRVDAALRALAAGAACPSHRATATVLPCSSQIVLFTAPVERYGTMETRLGTVSFDPDALRFGFPREGPDERVRWLGSAHATHVLVTEVIVYPGHTLAAVLARLTDLCGAPMACGHDPWAVRDPRAGTRGGVSPHGTPAI